MRLPRWRFSKFKSSSASSLQAVKDSASGSINLLFRIVMRRIYCLAAVTIIASVSACQNEEEHLNVTDMFDRTYHATFENDVPVRTALGADNDVLWSEGDQISVFVNPENLPYLLTDGAGTSRGEFNVNAVSEGDPSQMFSATASFYPYDSGVTVIENDGSFTFNATFPAIQTFSAGGTFGNGASPMVAVTSGPQDTDLSFKNVGAIFRLQLTGDAVITRIDFAANANLAGASDVMQNFSTIFADGRIGTSPKALWDKLIAFYSHAAETNANFAGYPKTYWEMFNQPVGYSGPDWDSYFNSYNAIADESQKLTKEEFTSTSWREYIVYLAPED